MTKEEKAEAYSKAVVKAKHEYNITTSEDRKQWLEELFPELMESEDERIRNVLIGWINLEPSTSFNDTFDGFSKEQILAWLEKQGEKKVANNVRPKFKVGDWCIDNEDGTIFQIVKVLDNSYKYRTNEGKEYSCSHYSLELDARLWTIQDAKEGDVLAAHECLVLFREIDGLNIRCYCTYHFMNNPIFSVDTLQNKDAFHPATKEQRDKLEKAMDDAGYTFDFDKKEMKEIEDEEYNDEDYGIDGLWHAKNILEKTLGKVEGYQTDDGILEHKCAISAVDRLYKHSIAWSEEDEHWMQKVIDFMNHPDLIKATPTLAKDTINWLKSLKDRVGNFDDGYKVGFSAAKHNQWKPSDEQVEVLSIYAHVHDVLASLYHDLKKLKG